MIWYIKILSFYLVSMRFLKTGFILEKSIQIDASKDLVWEYITQLQKKSQWSPWWILEREAAQWEEWTPWEVWYKEFWEWKIIGSWWSEIKEVRKKSFIKLELKFVKPSSSIHQVEYHLEENNGQTILTRKMKANFSFFLIFQMKKIRFFLEKDFSRGLIMLKKLVETWELNTKTEFVGKRNVDGKYYVFLHDAWSYNEVSRMMPRSFSTLKRILQEKNIDALSYFTLYTKVDIFNDIYEYRACIEISNEAYDMLLIYGDDDFDFSTFETGNYLQTTHYGSYEFIENSWRWAYMYAKHWNYKLNVKSPSIEYYEKWPANEEKPENWITHIYLQMK